MWVISLIEFSELAWPREFEATIGKFSFKNTNCKWQKHSSDSQQEMLNERLDDTLKKYGYA